jgi:hypothetical protein
MESMRNPVHLAFFLSLCMASTAQAQSGPVGTQCNPDQGSGVAGDSVSCFYDPCFSADGSNCRTYLHVYLTDGSVEHDVECGDSCGLVSQECQFDADELCLELLDAAEPPEKDSGGDDSSGCSVTHPRSGTSTPAWLPFSLLLLASRGLSRRRRR